MTSRKELISAYKEKKFRLGVFQIRNVTNNKIYIESSTDLESIWNRHAFQLNSGLHPNTNLQREWKEIGQENFVFEILSEIKQDNSTAANFKKEAKQLESMFIEELQPFDEKGYHIKP